MQRDDGHRLRTTDRSVSPEQIRYYLDGVVHFTINATAVDVNTWAQAVDHPFFILFDLAIGGGFPKRHL